MNESNKRKLSKPTPAKSQTTEKFRITLPKLPRKRKSKTPILAKLTPLPTPTPIEQRKPLAWHYESIADLLQKIREIKGMIAVPSMFRKICNDGDSAILLSQVCYWFDNAPNGTPRARAYRFTAEGRRRFAAKTHKEWAAETGMTPRRVRTVLGNLKQQGFIKTRVLQFKGRTQTHVYPCLLEILEALEQFRR